MANVIEIIIRTRGGEAVKGLEGVSKTLSGVGKSLSGVGQTLTRNVTKPIAAAGAAITGLGVISVNTAKSFESAFTGVIKTTDGLVDSTGNLTAAGEELRRGFRDLAKDVPSTVEELASIGELGGQLGIYRENLLDFTRTVADLGETTNLTTEEAATGFAQLSNILQTPQDRIANMGSAIVALGNNFATTERDVLAFSLRIAGAGKIAGLAESDVFGIAAAFSSVGIEAAAGGTAVQKVLIGINTAVSTSSDKLEAFAGAAGRSAEDFAMLWRTDPSQAFAEFVQGLGTAGDDAITILQDLGLEDERLVRAFLSLANAGELLPEALGLSAQAFEENIALTKEAETRYRTFESRLAMTRNKLRDVGITIGDALIPIIDDLLDQSEPMIEQLGEKLPEFLSGSLQPAIENTVAALKPFAEIALGVVQGFTDLDPVMQQNIVKWGLVAAAAGPALRIMGGGITVIAKISGILAGLPAILSGVAAGWTAWQSGLSLTTALGAAGLSPIAIALGAIGLALGSVVAVWVQWNKQIVETNREGQQAVKSTWEDFFQKQVASGADATQIAEEYRAAQDRVRQALEDTSPVLRLFIRDQDDLMGNTAIANAALIDASDSFEEYEQAAQIAGLGVDKTTRAQFEQIKALDMQEKATDEASDSLGRMGELEEQIASATAGLTEQTEGLVAAMLSVEDIAGIVEERFKEANFSTESMNIEMTNLALAMGQVTSEQVNLEQSVALVADAYAYGAISVDEFQEYIKKAKEGTLKLSDAERASLSVHTNFQKSMLENAKAAEAYTLKNLSLAESLKDASATEIARTAISELNRAFEDGELSFPDYVTAVSGVQESFGLSDEKSRALSGGLLELNQALIDGKLPAENYGEALQFLAEDADDGQINMQLLLDKFGVIPEAMTTAVGSLQTVQSEIANIPIEAETAAGDTEAAFSEQNWKGLGEDIAGGIASGIDAGTPQIEKAAREAAQAALEAAREELLAESPSRKFMELGLDSTAGLVLGLEAGEGEVSEAASDLAKNVLRAANDTLREGFDAMRNLEADILDPLRRKVSMFDRLVGVNFVDLTARGNTEEILRNRAESLERIAEVEEKIEAFRKAQERLRELEDILDPKEVVGTPADWEDAIGAATAALNKLFDLFEGVDLGDLSDMGDLKELIKQIEKLLDIEDITAVDTLTQLIAKLQEILGLGGLSEEVQQFLAAANSPMTPALAAPVSSSTFNNSSSVQNAFTFPLQPAGDSLDYRRLARLIANEIDERIR